MVAFGYTLMTEQAGPAELVRHAVAAEGAGFDFEVMSDHYSPWLASQGHAPNAWTTMGAVAHATETVGLMTYVTCPILRYHPAIVAQQAATAQLLSDNRFTLGLGAGENLNEHVVGQGWPSVAMRHEMLAEAIQIIAALFDGGLVDYSGNHFRVDSAKLWDCPNVRVPIATAVSGRESIEHFAPLSDHMVATDPKPELCQGWDEIADPEGRKIGQVPICWDRDRDTAVERAHDQFRWFGGGWKVNTDLPTTAGFEGASKFVRPEDVAGAFPCGPELEPIVEAVSKFWEAGFTDIALVQIGGEHQDAFFDVAEKELLPALRSAAPA